MDLTELGISSPGAALLCLKDQDRVQNFTHILKEIGIASVSEALSQKEAIDKMKYKQFDIIIIEDGFGGRLEDSQLMFEFWDMDISQRRKIFLVLIGDRWETGNTLQAFSLSVDLVVNYRLLDKFKEGLTSALLRHSKFYKVFNEYREALGKA